MKTYDPLKSDTPLSLENIPDFQPVEDLRHAERVEVDKVAWIRNPYGSSGTQLIAVRMHNVSRFGVGFISSMPYSKGDMLELFLEEKTTDSQRIMIRGSRELPEKAYLISAQFCVSDEFLTQTGIDPSKLDQEDSTQRKAS